MKMVSFKFSRPLVSASFLACALLFSSAAEPGFNKTNPTVVSNNPDEINQMIQAASQSDYFAHSLALNGNDVYNYMRSSGSSTIAVYFGFSMAGNFDDNNKVMIIVPVDGNLNTIPYRDCLLYNSSNLSFGGASPNANSSNQRITSGLARNYIAHFNENPNKQAMRGFVLQRSTLNNIIQNGTNSVVANLLLSMGKDQSGNDVIIASAKSGESGGTKSEIIDASALCPTNCDIY
jgi:hypothetical protein